MLGVEAVEVGVDIGMGSLSFAPTQKKYTKNKTKKVNLLSLLFDCSCLNFPALSLSIANLSKIFLLY